MGLTVLTTMDNAISANLLKSKLENEGIPCFLINEHFTNLMPQFYNILGSGVRVMVPADRLEEAKAIAQINASKVIRCPNCQSENIKNRSEFKSNKIVLFFLALIAAIPIGNLLNEYICLECQQEFRK